MALFILGFLVAVGAVLTVQDLINFYNKKQNDEAN